jgi:modification methylase
VSKYRYNKLNVIHNESTYPYNISFIPNNSIDLVITSPPYYGAGKEYEEYIDAGEYWEMLEETFKEICKRKLKEGGRLCVNIANMGRKPYYPLNYLLGNYLRDIGLQMRGEIIWNKSASVGSSTAWGSWKSASNPTLRDQHEYIVVFSKGDFKRKEKGISTITRDEFLEFTKSIWNFKTESSKFHPAIFPIELPYRLIQLYSYKGDVILDPFMGSGTTAIACIKTGRKYIGFEKEEKYVELAEERIAKFKKELKENEIRKNNEKDSKESRKKVDS